MAKFEHVKASFWGAGTHGVQPPLTDALIHQAEELLAVDLPPELLELLRLRNGGPVADAWSAFPTRQPTSWSPDHVPFTNLQGIGDDGHSTTLLDSPYLTTEWDLPPRLVLLCGDGHYWIALDYRTQPEPCVTWFDIELETELHLAADFRAFIEGLMSAEDLAG